MGAQCRPGPGRGLVGKKIPTNPEAVGSNDSILVLPVRDVNPGLTLLVADRLRIAKRHLCDGIEITDVAAGRRLSCPAATT